ncbi:MAG: DinB family protein [Bryobacteraceae bacterium]
MTVSRETLREHLLYTAWATGRLVEAMASLTPEELNRDFGTSDRNPLGTLVHVFAADRIWLARLHGQAQGPFITEADRDFTRLRDEIPALHQRWIEWIDRLPEDGAEENSTYTDIKGREWTNPTWQVVLHVVNHATHHRGQISGFLRAMGKTPPPLDLIAYYRQKRNG